jgi:hypothetical protein
LRFTESSFRRFGSEAGLRVREGVQIGSMAQVTQANLNYQPAPDRLLANDYRIFRPYAERRARLFRTADNLWTDC